MIESELPIPSGEDLGPPVLLKRLGNAVEANLAKNKLATAGIPAFLGGENAFAGDLMHPLPYREVELFVPASLVNEALDVLDAPPDDPAEVAFEPIVDDPAVGMSFRAFVASVVGCLLVFVVGLGFVLAWPFLAYGAALAFRALRVAETQTVSIRAKCASAFLLSLAGFAMSAILIVELSRG